MAKAKAEVVGAIRAKPGKKTIIKLHAPAGIDFDALTGIESVYDNSHIGIKLKWSDFEILGSSTVRMIKFVMTAANRPILPANSAGAAPDLPDAGVITVTLSNPPAGLDAEVEKLPVDYVDKADSP